MSVSEQYQSILNDVKKAAKACERDPNEILVVAVSKKHNWEEVKNVYDDGCRNFGESYVQEALEKISKGPDDIHWHLIGSLQRKKVSKIIDKFHLIHSVDSLELAQKISECSYVKELETSILLEVNTSMEKSKHGFSPETLRDQFNDIDMLPNVNVKGLMTMAPFTQDEKVIRRCFSLLRDLKDELGLQELSMGMTNDYKIAIEEGATILRIGTAIFGKRDNR